MQYVFKRALLLIFTIWIALTINFLLPRAMPGNPAQVMIAKYRGRIRPEAIEALEIAFGVDSDRTVFQQYIDYLKRMVTGDFGISVTFYPANVSEVLSQSIFWTIGLLGVTTIISFLLGIRLGIWSGWRRDSPLSTTTIFIALFLNSTPYFWVALIAVYVFGLQLGWFPLSGAYASGVTGWRFIGSVLYHAILPALTIIITATGGWILTMRNNMLSVLQEDYISFAKAKGLPEKVIISEYAARNAILPSFTGFAMALGFIVGGSLITETVFNYPGVGYMLYQSVLNIDYPLMQALFLFIMITVLVANFIADLTYSLLDPRIRTGGGI